MIESSQTQTHLKNIGFIIILLFAFLRPLALGVSEISFFRINILELFAVAISYLLILIIIVNIGSISLNKVGLLILVFSIYCLFSVAWGSSIKNIVKQLLPFLLFYSIPMYVENKSQIKQLLFVIVGSFLIPILISSYNIINDRSIQLIEHWNELERHSGAFSGSHTLAYSMLVFSYFYCMFYKIVNPQKKINQLGINSMLFLSIYCLYKSHTRTAIIGFVLFWALYFWGNSKKQFFFSFLILSIVLAIFYVQVNELFWKKTDDFNLNRATSGRIEMWQDNIQLFNESNLVDKLLGSGYGVRKEVQVHNDYLGLLMSLGMIGLSLYILILSALFLDIILCSERRYKYIFGGILISLSILNFGSNAVISRFELSQYFWLTMGLFYVIDKKILQPIPK